MRDAKEIVRRLRAGNVGIAELQAEYRCGWPAICAAMGTEISADEWRRIKKARQARWTVKTQLKKGGVPWNKGLKGIHMSPATEFKRGGPSVNRKPVGSVKIRRHRRDGRLRWIKVADEGGRRDWIEYARFVWERANGPIPKGRLVVHADGDRLNDDPANLRLVDRRGHLALLKQRDPRMAERAKARSAKATRERHARNRREKERLRKEQLRKEQQQRRRNDRQREKEAKEAERRRRRAMRDAEQRRMLEAGIEELQGPRVSGWECIGCGNEFDEKPEGICPKCNGLRFEHVLRRGVA